MEWPEGKGGYTVVIASLPAKAGAAEARAKAQAALDAGLGNVGVLRTARFPNLAPGYLVVFSGVYSTAGEAQQAAAHAASRFPGAYPRQIAAPVVQWPEGRAGYTVVLASLPASAGRAAAEEKATEASARDLPKVGVLGSDEFSSLQPGFLVVFSGVYATLEQAEAAAAQAAAAYPAAYARPVTP
jgi:hypothetical protein